MFIYKDKYSPYYQVIHKVNGVRKKISTKKKLKSEALKFLSEFEKNVSKEPVIENRDLERFKEEYKSYAKLRYSESYIRAIDYSFELLKRAAGNMELHKYDLRILENFFTDTFDRSNHLASLCCRTLKSAFTKAVSWNYIKENQIKKIKLPKIPQAFPVFISPDELKLIIKKTEKKIMKDIFTFAFYTGLRLSEIINLRWKQVDLPGMKISVSNTDDFKTKNKKDRIIPLNGTTFNILKNRFPKILLIGKNELVFWKIYDVKINADHISKEFKKAVRDAKVDDRVHFHTLRHSFASLLIQKGVSLYVVKELLGHEDIKTTQIYSHLKSENLFDAVRILDIDSTRRTRTAKNRA